MMLLRYYNHLLRDIMCIAYNNPRIQYFSESSADIYRTSDKYRRRREPIVVV